MSSLNVVDLKKVELSDTEPAKKDDEKEVDPQDDIWAELVRTLDRLERGIEGDMSLLGRGVRSLNRFRLRFADYTWLRAVHQLIPESYRKEFIDLIALFNPNTRDSEIKLISKLASVSVMEAETKLNNNNNDVSKTILQIVSEKEELAKKEIKRQQEELKKEREEREAKKLEKGNKEGKKENNNNNNSKKDDKNKDTKKSDKDTKDDEKKKELEVSLLPLKERKKKRQFYPEIYVFLQLLIALELFDNKKYGPSIDIFSKLIKFTKEQNRRTCDLLTARVYQFYSLAHQRQFGKLSQIRKQLYDLYQTACLQQNEPGQGVLINLILQNYISENLYALAHKFGEKSEFPDSCESQQFARYHYYRGRIDTVQLAYADALFHMQQAIRRAPQQGAIGFKLTSTKWLIAIHLLMGDIPDRTLFRSFKSTTNREKLLPYLEMTEAVREGRIDQFNACLTKNKDVFKQQGLHKVLLRLRHNVIKTGLRAINRSYSRISLEDVANKLGLESTNDAYYIVAKAIRDGVIDATIDYEKKYVEARKMPDVYATGEPYEQFSTRVKFCLDIYNTGIKSLRYPEEKNDKKDEDKDNPTPEEIADMIRKEIEEDNDDD